ncbi:transcription antitermination factor NusB [Candidatus Roizmanbacteria bacterium RIFCSPHIGHO2_12_FULL_33_9]|uniref:Transcription antitermination protein NusB n=1 Tax=Candidatus Roizmanbacteria bacterium RIFCSPHIGHO2_12_FULL_33_9 TaxID=1802045 RepID=A0A1F7HIH0_9BACT|nr:MAG: transcription antitermination factor NusB [Candidatus Roizmanbacteria bacterium RIFCSPHIGHO2_12_FULL_33_9]
MKDIRHQNRINIIKKLFSLSFTNQQNDDIKVDNSVLNNILKNNNKIEKIISKYATRYPIEKVSKIDLAILKLSTYELIIEKKNPPKVIIDEAVELAKEYGNERSYSFVNGVLGAILKDIDNEK